MRLTPSCRGPAGHTAPTYSDMPLTAGCGRYHTASLGIGLVPDGMAEQRVFVLASSKRLARG